MSPDGISLDPEDDDALLFEISTAIDQCALVALNIAIVSLPMTVWLTCVTVYPAFVSVC